MLFRNIYRSWFFNIVRVNDTQYFFSFYHHKWKFIIPLVPASIVQGQLLFSLPEKYELRVFQKVLNP